MKKKEAAFVILLLSFASLWMVWSKERHFKENKGAVRGQVVVQVAGNEYGSYPLKEDRIIKIGENNLLEITGGRVRMREARCPDQTCVEQGYIKTAGESIICLPNQVVVTLEKTLELLDGVVQ